MWLRGRLRQCIRCALPHAPLGCTQPYAPAPPHTTHTHTHTTHTHINTTHTHTHTHLGVQRPHAAHVLSPPQHLAQLGSSLGRGIGVRGWGWIWGGGVDLVWGLIDLMVGLFTSGPREQC